MAVMSVFVFAALTCAAASDDSVALLQTHAGETIDSDQGHKEALAFLKSPSESGDAPLFSDESFGGGPSRIITPMNRGKCMFGHSAQNPPRRERFYSCPGTLPHGFSDMRGDWWGPILMCRKGMGCVPRRQHEERIEQCEDRVTVSTQKGVRDFPHADGTGEYGAADFDPTMLPKCKKYYASGKFDASGCFTITPNPSTNGNAKVETRCLFADGTLRIKIGRRPWITLERVGSHGASMIDRK